MCRQIQNCVFDVLQHLNLRFWVPGLIRAVAVCGLLISSSLWAQMEIGRLNGTVLDPTGARVAQAEVSLDNHLTGRQVRTSSDSQGQFRIENIPYGTYVLQSHRSPALARLPRISMYAPTSPYKPQSN